jgi:NAD(P)-dependent dehydrogenase (short-subunit alcohol dehydrogenase family)
MLLKDKICIITGGGSKRGLGRATAHLFAQHGAKVAILDMDGAAAKEKASELKGKGHMGLTCDVTKRAQCDKAIARVLAKHGRIDVLINNAGISQRSLAIDTDFSVYERILAVDLLAPIALTQRILPHLDPYSTTFAQHDGADFGRVQGVRREH